MKKTFAFLFLSILMFVFWGCATLYVAKNRSPSEEETKNLQAILDTISFEEQQEYFLVFDCSNKSAYVFDFLNQMGYECSIIVGCRSPIFFNIDGSSSWHAWVEAKKNNKIFYVESTTKKVVDPGCFDQHIWKFRFSSLNILRKLAKLGGLKDEWEY